MVVTVTIDVRSCDRANRGVVVAVVVVLPALTIVVVIMAVKLLLVNPRLHAAYGSQLGRGTIGEISGPYQVPHLKYCCSYKASIELLTAGYLWHNFCTFRAAPRFSLLLREKNIIMCAFRLDSCVLSDCCCEKKKIDICLHVLDYIAARCLTHLPRNICLRVV